jgi:hypothetical protein
MRGELEPEVWRQRAARKLEGYRSGQCACESAIVVIMGVATVVMVMVVVVVVVVVMVVEGRSDDSGLVVGSGLVRDLDNHRPLGNLWRLLPQTSTQTQKPNIGTHSHAMSNWQAQPPNPSLRDN